MALVALTDIVPLPASGTMTVAVVAEALTTTADDPPKVIVASSSPRPPIVTSAPGCPAPGDTDDTSGHDHPAARGVPRPVTGS